MSAPRKVIGLAGPNGAGKSTLAPHLLEGVLAVSEFVDADEIARGLAGATAMTAGRAMLNRLKRLTEYGSSFAFETTLANRAPWLARLIRTGYSFHLVFLWLPSADFAVERVAQRVRLGGHDVPEAWIRRRFARGLRNFFELYQPLTTSWRMYDNSIVEAGPRLIATGRGNSTDRVLDVETWRRIQRGAHG